MQTVFIGTTPVILANAQKERVRWTIEFTPVGIVAGNTGHVFVGRGFPPNAVVGDPNQGDVLNPGASIEEKKQYADDSLPYKGVLWAVADAADQQCSFDETLASETDSGASAGTPSVAPATP